MCCATVCIFARGCVSRLRVASTTSIYALSLHDALPISLARSSAMDPSEVRGLLPAREGPESRLSREVCRRAAARRSEEHTSELQSPCNLVCRLLLEKKKQAPEAAGGDRWACREDAESDH